jgi:hypothetical protein
MNLKKVHHKSYFKLFSLREFTPGPVCGVSGVFYD